jgi:hypothetical protein
MGEQCRGLSIQLRQDATFQELQIVCSTDTVARGVLADAKSDAETVSRSSITCRSLNNRLSNVKSLAEQVAVLNLRRFVLIGCSVCV